MRKDDKDISNQAGTSDGKGESANLRADMTAGCPNDRRGLATAPQSEAAAKSE